MNTCPLSSTTHRGMLLHVQTLTIVHILPNLESVDYSMAHARRPPRIPPEHTVNFPAAPLDEAAGRTDAMELCTPPLPEVDVAEGLVDAEADAEPDGAALELASPATVITSSCSGPEMFTSSPDSSTSSARLITITHGQKTKRSIRSRRS